MSDMKTRRGLRESVPSAGATATPAEPMPAAAPEMPPIAATPPIAQTAAAIEPAHQTAALIEPAHQAPAAAAEDVFAYGREAWAALADAQAAAARGFEAMVGEMTNLTRSEFAAAADRATAMLGVKTLAEAVEINLGFARRSFDAVIGSSAKLSEIGVKTAADASRPVLSRFGPSRFGPSRYGEG